jgi:hypothetical protein
MNASPQRVSQLESKVRSLEIENRRLLLDLQTSQSTLADVQTRLGVAEDKYSVCRQERDSLTLRVQALEKERASWENDKDGSHVALGRFADELSQFTAEFNKVASEHQKQKQAVVTLRSFLANEYAERLVPLRNAVNSMKAEFKDLIQKTVTESQLPTVIASVNTLVNMCQTKTAKSQQLCNALSMQLIHVQSSYDALRRSKAAGDSASDASLDTPSVVPASSLWRHVDVILEEENRLLRDLLRKKDDEMEQRKKIFDQEQQSYLSVISTLRSRIERSNTMLDDAMTRRTRRDVRTIIETFQRKEQSQSQFEYLPDDPRDPVDVSVCAFLRELSWPFKVRIRRLEPGIYQLDQPVSIRISNNGTLVADVQSNAAAGTKKRSQYLRAYLEQLYAPMLRSSGKEVSSRPDDSVSISPVKTRSPAVPQQSSQSKVSPARKVSPVKRSMSTAAIPSSNAAAGKSSASSRHGDHPIHSAPAAHSSSSGNLHANSHVDDGVMDHAPFEDENDIRRRKREALRMQVLSMRSSLISQPPKRY